ncbi:MAG: response regulator transcription factor [Bacteroidota bacterium]
MKYQVGIVDDNDKIAGQIAENLLLTDEVDILFMANDGREALQWLSKHKTHPDILLMDIEMPVMNGVEATFKIKGLYDKIRIIMLTVFDNEANIFNAIRAGASGYLLKDETLPRMMDALADVTDGGVPMSPPIAKKAMQMMVEGYKPEKQLLYTEEQEALSNRELEILTLMAEGAGTPQICNKIFISPATLKKHLQNIYRKLHVKSRVELLLWYQQA